MTDLMDDLAMEIHAYLVKKFQRNHRTIQRRISALKDEGLLLPVIRKNTITLYHVKEQEDQP
jgi:hypothetical protein